jgi:cytochrome b561
VALTNSAAGYGTLTKAFHWTAAALFAFQLFSGPLMVRMADGARVLGMDGNEWFNWHKTIGLVALIVAVGRLANRRVGSLPDWAPCLSRTEHALIHRYEQALYVAMFALPVSGFLYVMAGDYGVLFAGVWALPNPIGKVAWLAALARWAHFGFALLLAASLLAHLGVVVRHTLVRPARLLRRML